MSHSDKHATDGHDSDCCFGECPATPHPLYTCCSSTQGQHAQQRCFLCQRSMAGLTLRPQNIDELRSFVRDRCQVVLEMALHLHTK